MDESGDRGRMEEESGGRGPGVDESGEKVTEEEWKKRGGGREWMRMEGRGQERIVKERRSEGHRKGVEEGWEEGKIAKDRN